MEVKILIAIVLIFSPLIKIWISSRKNPQDTPTILEVLIFISSWLIGVNLIF